MLVTGSGILLFGLALLGWTAWMAPGIVLLLIAIVLLTFFLLNFFDSGNPITRDEAGDLLERRSRGEQEFGEWDAFTCWLAKEDPVVRAAQQEADQVEVDEGCQEPPHLTARGIQRMQELARELRNAED